MIVKIKYEYVGELTDFLFNLSLKGKKSRHRTRLVNLLLDKHKQIAEEEMAIIKEFAGTDKDGEPKRKENGNLDIKNVKEFKKQQEELFREEFVIEGGDHHGMLKTVKEIIFDYDEEISGRQAVVYDHLYEAFENANEKEGE
ncbi:DUF1617 family protein [Sutcliffiella halmapala]|uniref:DUF1617 family protein n=1 Tax=Sutcliffiella halmapala TaxID=79882 RepID=UPI000994ED0A|nr:DUF1617 family protein [Sutcliffiella halmapala]